MGPEKSATPRKVILYYHPSEMYNFTGFTTGTNLFLDPIEMAEINGLAVLKILHAIHTIDPDIKFCQATSSQIFQYSRISTNRIIPKGLKKSFRCSKNSC